MINKKPPINEAAVMQFAGGAPDEKKAAPADEEKAEPPKAARKPPAKVRKAAPAKRPIVMNFDLKLLAQIDEIAAAQGQSRAAIIRMGMYYAINRGIFKE